MKDFKLGFIGYGEAAYLISKGLKENGLANQYVYDINANDTLLGPGIKERVEKNNVSLLASYEELFNKASIILCATSAKVALNIAENIAPYLTEQHIYIDLNASSPMIQESIGSVINKTKAKFVDVAIMESVPSYQHKVPMFISGDGSNFFSEFAELYGLNVRIIHENPGTSSAIKMFRSIFMKGVTNLLIETLEASEKYDVTDIVLDSLNNSITKQPLNVTANNLITRTGIHAERRISEMEEVIKTLKEINIKPLMSEATKNKLQQIVDNNIREQLNDRIPKSYKQVINLIDQ